MKQEMTRNSLMNSTGIAGLTIGLVPVAHLYLTKAIGAIPNSTVALILTFLIWALKFGGCIYLMMFFMKRFHSRYEGVAAGTLRRFGLLASLLSALVYSGVYLADMLILSPEYFTNAFNQAMASYSSIMDSNSLAAVDKIMENMPQITFFSNLIYCFIYGAVLSAILSRMIIPDNPFADMENEENE